MPWNIIQFPKSSMLLCSTIPDEYTYIYIYYDFLWHYLALYFIFFVQCAHCMYVYAIGSVSFFTNRQGALIAPPPLYFLKWMLQQWHTWEASSSGMGWWWPPCCRRGQPGSPHPTQASRTTRQCRFSKEKSI